MRLMLCWLIEGLDLVSVGPRDWVTGLGLSDAYGQAELEPKIDQIIARTTDAGKMTILNISSPKQADWPTLLR